MQSHKIIQTHIKNAKTVNNDNTQNFIKREGVWMDNFIIYIKKNKAVLIITFLIWLFAIIFLILIISYSISESTINFAFSIEIFK